MTYVLVETYAFHLFLKFLIHSLLGFGEQGQTEDIKQCPLLSYPAPHPIGRIFHGSRRHTVSPNDTVTLVQCCLPTQKLKPSRSRQTRAAHRLICPHCRQLIFRNIILKPKEMLQVASSIVQCNITHVMDQRLCL